MESAILCSRSRRVTSDIDFPHFFGQILSRTPSQRDDRERGVLIGIADKWRGIGYEQILHFMRLAIFVQDRLRWIAAHANRSELMNDLAAIGNTLARHEIGTRRRNFAAHGFKQRLKSVVHVLRLLQLLIGPLEVKTQYWSSVLIHHVGIQLAESIFIGDLFSGAGHRSE